MIGISTKTIYAMAAIHQLGLLKENELLNIRALADRANAPEKFLGQILLELKKSNILSSTKGANGGYSLAKPLKEISLRDVIEILENNAFEEVCQTENATLKLFWEETQKSLIKVFNMPLSELKTYQDKATKSFNYTI
jgi:Rrf2 family protein